MNALRARAGLWLLLAIGLVLACVVQFVGPGHIQLQTNLLTLLPSTERNPLAEQVVSRLADAAGNRAIFLVGLPAPATATDAGTAARTFAQQLRGSPAFHQVISDVPPFDPKQIAQFYLPYRYHLLSGEDRSALATGNPDLQGRLQRKLYAPFRIGLALSSADDPFGLGDNWLSALPLGNLKLEPQNGLLMAHSEDTTWVFVAGELAGSAYDDAVQKQLAQSVHQAESALLQTYPNARVLRTGTVFYAETARSSAEGEMNLIGTGSLVGMLLMLYLVFRSLRPLALGLLSVGFGIAAAVSVTGWVYGEIHLITLVFGASLIGEAIDYAVQYFAAHLGAGADWEPLTGLRRIAPGLTVALGTSLLGYGALMLTPFPALSQIALFALVGLGAAWLSVFLLLPAMLTRANTRNPETSVALAQRLLVWWQARMSRKACYLAAGLLLLIAAPGWLHLQGNDDIRLLVARPPLLVAQEEKIRDLVGLGSSGPFFLVEGASAEAVLTSEEKLTEGLAQLMAQGHIAGYQSTCAFVPSAQRQMQNHTLWQDKVFADPSALGHLLNNAGLRDSIASQQLVAFKNTKDNVLTVDRWLQEPLSTPYRHLWLGQGARGFASVVLPQGVRDAAQLQAIATGVPGVTLVDKAASVSRLFRDYRRWGALWLLGAVCIVYGVLCVRYGVTQAAVVLAPTVLAMALALGVFGYLNAPFTLFNLMGLILVLGVGVNYAIFLREGGVRRAATLAGVILSAGTTLLSFGLLAFSSMPALSGFGLTLLMGIGISVVLAPIVLSFEPTQVA